MRLPKMSVGSRWLGQVKSFEETVPLVDEVKTLSGGVCTVFQRINAKGDMLRVATNVKAKRRSRRGHLHPRGSTRRDEEPRSGRCLER